MSSTTSEITEITDYVIDNNKRKTYKRGYSKLKEELNNVISKLYGDDKLAYVTSSGMSAIRHVFDIVSKSQTHEDFYFVSSHEIYCDTHHEYTRLKKYIPGFNVVYFNVVNNVIVEKKGREFVETEIDLETFFKEKGDAIKLMFIESVTNPSGFIFDYKCLGNLKKLAPKCVMVCDNTWTSVSLFNPLDYQFVDYQFDVVTNSLTKHYSGGKHIMGAIIFNGKYTYNNVDFSRAVFLESKMYHISDAAIQIVLDNISSLEERMVVNDKRMKELILYFGNRDMVLMHPFVKSHPSYERRGYLAKYPATIWCFINNISKNKVVKYCQKNLNYSTSYGKERSCVDPWHEKGTDPLDVTSSSSGMWIRISVGYNETDGQFKEFLGKVNDMIPKMMVSKSIKELMT
jgi:cystathionine beta-lyase/cystathionine gamma-synthase